MYRTNIGSSGSPHQSSVDGNELMRHNIQSGACERPANGQPENDRLVLLASLLVMLPTIVSSICTERRMPAATNQQAQVPGPNRGADRNGPTNTTKHDVHP
ncbi:uncharacterized protein SPSK_10112 [Sporothrix schenckii 1099-18]|uniref:Uncharacterized protein n=1 Tax=Sporothrix schenckii 1099-18 TaxID=1397361 RepID=A0A0F2M8C5_SPOSC|nr:uncharacterized protein SPSK_10112 [Sporothrix schenckii 1099-18]KJR85897.1 hypothetical protein SPSK_10112 [Sporothrix schenckii 1099-18]